MKEKITELKPDMMLQDVFNDYPGLKEYMLEKSDKFAQLDSPLFKVMKKIATIEMVSEKTGIDFDVLQREFKKYIGGLNGSN